MSFIDKLLNNNKKYILSSIYQNTIYKDKPLYEYFGVEKVSNKNGKPFYELLTTLVNDIVVQVPAICIYKNGDSLKPFYECVVRNGNRYIKIKDYVEYVRQYNDKDVLSFISPPTFFSRKYKLHYTNMNTGKTNIEYVLNKNDIRIAYYNSYFKLVDESNIDVMFENTNIEDYKKIREFI